MLCYVVKSWMKFWNPTHSLLRPNASSTWKDCKIACAAGQKKKMPMIAICGSSSNQGSQADRKRTRFSICLQKPKNRRDLCEATEVCEKDAICLMPQREA